MKQKSVLILTKPMSHVRLGGIARFARSRAKNVHCAGEMIYYRPGEPKEIQTKPQGDASS